MKFTVILAPEAEGGYPVICPAIPGCVSQGDSLEDAMSNIPEAILLCPEVRRDEGLPRPVETPEVYRLEPALAAQLRQLITDDVRIVDSR